MTETTAICRDEDCPECGFPETYAEVDLAISPPGAEAVGCRRCGWRITAEPTEADTP